MTERVTVLGLGETGLASALFLKGKGYSVFVSDSQTSKVLEERGRRLAEASIPFELGAHTLERIGESDWVLISPGILPSGKIFQFLQKKGISILSEIELASKFSTGVVTAVTGTSGKTTLTTLIHRIYEANALASVACGNIGNPWVGEMERLTPDTQVVLELSSFQLLHTHSLKPRFAILLNIGPNHLDWHPDLEHYVKAKLRLFQNQGPEDFAFVRKKDREKFFPNFQFRAQVVPFGDTDGVNSNEDLLYRITEIRGLDPKKTRKVLANFEGLEHRLEEVAQIRGIRFINDSKCTTLEALEWALNRFPKGKVILLAGGHAKGADFRLIRNCLGEKLKQAVVYGEARELLRESWEGACPLWAAKDLKEAFERSLRIAEEGDVVLLSPACASFDQFSNYQERGKAFKGLVAQAGV